MAATADQPGQLIVTADDWGYSSSYNAGIVRAARAGAIDAVSAMVLRTDCDPAIAETGVEVGLHLELPESWNRRELFEAPRRQAEMFLRIFGRPPAYVDGHHHCHASPPTATVVEGLALELSVPVRSAGEDHRLRLRERGIATTDRTIGRLHEAEPALPRPLADALAEGVLPPGTTEWVVHPGHSDPGSGSGYDRGRGHHYQPALLGTYPAVFKRRADRIGSQYHSYFNYRVGISFWRGCVGQFFP